MFGVLKNLTKAVVGVATLPIDIAADIVTLGGAMNDKDEPYTAKKIDEIVDNIEKAVDQED